MNVVDVWGYHHNLLIGPAHGATRIFLWAVTEEARFAVSPHHHHGDELFRVLYGRLRFSVGDSEAEIGAGQVVVVPPGMTHAHEALEDTEIEIYGEIGGGIFVWAQNPDGTMREEELFVPDVPWSSVPHTGQSYLTPEQHAILYPAGTPKP